MTTAFARVYSAELDGIDARLVEVEVDLHIGLHAFTIVGLADKALSEARERVNAALKNSGIKPPTKENRKIVVNLAPADVKKNGSQYDLAIALGYAMATNQIKPKGFNPQKAVFVGELALDGSVRSVRGILSIARLARASEAQEIYVPYTNRAEAALVAGIRVIPVRFFAQLIAHMEEREIITPQPQTSMDAVDPIAAVDMKDIKGQGYAKRALFIAAAGGHHILLIGSPGGGKTMLAQAFAGILPPLSFDEVIEATQIYSAAGLLGDDAYVQNRPFRAPHHTASEPAIIGGGSQPRPGEISLANRGVLFLDELPEFHRDVLESLRQPMESGQVIVARSRGNLKLPARFMFIAAMNPCPCGYYGDTHKECTCNPHEALRYQKKLSGPILDRIDIQINVPRVELEELKGAGSGMKSSDMRTQVAEAHAVQRRRFGKLNAEISSKQCDAVIKLTTAAEKFIEKAWQKSLLTARGYYRTLKVAQTIADCGQSPSVDEKHVTEAFGYRLREK